MPDINSIPASPYATPRRASVNQTATLHAQTTNNGATPMGPPPVPQSPTQHILPSNQPSFSQATSGSSIPTSPRPPNTTNMPPPPIPGQDNTGVGAGPGPLRHPRPLTAAELHSQLEQEQELLVNRLTRDLSLLRAAQNSSVVSNTSSTSASTSDHVQASSFTDTHLLSGPGFPIPTTSADRRHHRTSSSTSTRSFSLAATAGSTPAPIQPLDAARNPRSGGISMSRQNSTASHRSTSASRTRSPRPGSFTQAHGFPYLDGQGTGSGYFPRGASNPHSSAATPGSNELSPGLLPATLRYEETAQYRMELENAKRENEALKRRVKELEKMVRERRESDASTTAGVGGSRVRSESVSTTASVSVSGAGGVGGGGTSIAGGRASRGPDRSGMERAVSSLSVAGSVGVGVPEDEVKVGESAASSGFAEKAQERK